MSDTKPKGLHAKLAEVMAEAGRIPKNGKAPAAMGGFEFVQVGDAADAIRSALGKRGVSMLPSVVEIINESEHETRSGGTMTTQTLRMTWTLTDGETGATAVIQSLGTGADTGDKFSPKAQSNSMKYALLMGFLLSTGDDPELADSSDRKARRDRVADAAVERQGVMSAPREPQPNPITDGVFGVAAKGTGDADFEMRQTTVGPRVAFRLVEGRTKLKVEALGTLAELITEHRAGIEDVRVQAWGEMREESFTPKDATRPVTYRVLRLTRLKVGPLDLTEPEPDDDAPAEAESLEMGLVGSAA